MTRALLRYSVAEQNRLYLGTWEIVQMGLGLALPAVLLWSGIRKRSTYLLTVLMIVVVAVQHWVLSPEVLRLGRTVDFEALNQQTAARSRLVDFRTAYLSSELAKLGFGLILAVQLVNRSRRRYATNVWNNKTLPEEFD